MMSELIPLLWELVHGSRSGNGRAEGPTDGWAGVPVEFVPTFVSLHHGRAGDGGPARNGRASFTGAQVRLPAGNSDADWRAAQAHWEVVVARVLDTDIVKPNVSGEVAIRRAVRASALLLNKMARQGRCPICPQPVMVSS
jgi:hypothetical protein